LRLVSQLQQPWIMASHQSEPVTRIACFRFRENVTAEQKGDRTRAFLNLYKQNEDLLLGMPKGGKPLNTPLNLTNVKRDSVWDTGFIVTFKVWLAFGNKLFLADWICRTKRRGRSSIRSLVMTS
jgi:hypothetical protein